MRSLSQQPLGLLMSIGARRRDHSAMSPPCSSFHSLILAKFLPLDMSCNIFALFIMTALIACSFSIKRCAKMSVFCVKTAIIRWRLRPQTPLASGEWGLRSQIPSCAAPCALVRLCLGEPWCATVYVKCDRVATYIVSDEFLWYRRHTWIVI